MVAMNEGGACGRLRANRPKGKAKPTSSDTRRANRRSRMQLIFRAVENEQK